MTTSADLIELAYRSLTVKADTTAAGARVFKPGDWAIRTAECPKIRLRVPTEQKRSGGRGAIAFTVVATLRFDLFTSAPAEEDDEGATVAEAALWVLKEQVERAVINSPYLTGKVQHFPFVNTQLVYSAEGEEHVAGARIDLGVEFYQGPEDFYEPIETAVTDMRLTPSNYPPAVLDIPLQT